MVLLCDGKVEVICGDAQYLVDHAYEVDLMMLPHIRDYFMKNDSVTIKQAPQALHHTAQTPYHGTEGHEYRKISFAQHVKEIEQPAPIGRALYMDNASVHDYLPLDQIKSIVSLIPQMEGDILNQIPNLYTGHSSGSIDFLGGGDNSYTRCHQDGPMRCPSRK
jgi:hypothetical protein